MCKSWLRFRFASLSPILFVLSIVIVLHTQRTVSLNRTKQRPTKQREADNIQSYAKWKSVHDTHDSTCCGRDPKPKNRCLLCPALKKVNSLALSLPPSLSPSRSLFHSFSLSLSPSLSVCLPVCLSLPLPLSLYLSISLSLSLYLSISLSLYLSISLSICLSISSVCLFLRYHSIRKSFASIQT
jgi:hypothetical protein